MASAEAALEATLDGEREEVSLTDLLPRPKRQPSVGYLDLTLGRSVHEELL